MSTRHHRYAWARLARAVKDRAGWRCTKCARPGKLEAHHLRPGDDSLDALICLCDVCHRAIHSTVPADRREWRRRMAANGR